MLKSKRIDFVCIAVTVLAAVLTLLFMNGEKLGLTAASGAPGYETRLFDRSKVHTIDILIDDWDAFLETAPEEEYSPCTLVIDGEKFSNVGLRAKGNNSRRLTEKYGMLPTGGSDWHGARKEVALGTGKVPLPVFERLAETAAAAQKEKMQ